jgi:hypothetical protein
MNKKFNGGKLALVGSIIGAALLVTAGVAPASAAEPVPAGLQVATDGTAVLNLPASTTDPKVDQVAAELESSGAIEEMSETHSFDYGAAVASGVSVETANDWAQGVAIAGGAVSNAPASLETSLPSAVASRAACRGVNKLWSDAFGSHVKLDSCNTIKLVAALQSGAGATAVLAVLAGAGFGASTGALAAIVPSIIQYSAWSVDACSKNGTGVELVLGGIICWAQ